ncbi:hypothetical protein [Geomesophilobacter sediminis]|uniref:Outer membrane cytochrome MtrC/MtrF-like domain-containing protein n=1 Tax=Geomesophilobacter sediminis TaxID=2798584 RepID=A0A8J7S7Z5_9BACT|nr:hypothetical protein [Geomesophilobacter sediminis]MBJ6727331.1 hypothetical protein [Geomesophilobacter sediminis]
MSAQTVLDGPIYRSYTTAADIPVTVKAGDGYTIRYLVINGDLSNPVYPDRSKGQDTNWTYTLPGSYDNKDLAATFLPKAISVTAAIDSGTATPSSIGNVTYGYKLASPVTFNFIPSKGGEITNVANVPSDPLVTTSGFSRGADKPVWVKFSPGYVFVSDINLAATVVNTTPRLNAILAQNALPTDLVQLSASGKYLPADAVFTWNYVSGPANTPKTVYENGKLKGYSVDPGPALPGFPQVGTASFIAPSVPGQYKFLLTVSSPTTPAFNLNSVATVNVFASKVSTARNQCQFCHSANRIGPQTPNGPDTLYLNWSSSMHKVNNVMCANCHVGSSTAGHMGTLIGGQVNERTFSYTNGSGSFCLNGTCHNTTAKPFVTHKTVGITCAYCHYSGEIHNINANFADDMSNAVCLNCHSSANAPHYFTWLSLKNDCLKCHNTSWMPHTDVKAAFFKGVVPPAHFNGYTSYVNPNYAAAYVTPTTACSNCHVAGNPDPASADSQYYQYRMDWSGSAHGDVKGAAWLNSATHNWKASGQAGVDVSQAGNPTDCQRCHTAKGYALYNISSSIAPIDASKPIYSEPLTCNGCHNPDFSVRSISARTAYYNYSSQTTGKLLVSRTFPDSGFSNVCLGCHMGRQAGATINAMAGAAAAKGGATADAFWGNVSFVNSHYLAAGGEVFRTIGYEFAGQTYSNAVDHSLVNNGSDGPCVTCHMQTKNAVTHSHTLSPSVANYAVCQNCHGSSFNDAFVQAKSADFQAALQALGNALTQKGFVPNLVNGQLAYPYFAAKNWGDRNTGPNNMGAAFNYNQLMHDPGAFAHNPTYVKRLVRDSIDYLMNGSVNRSRDLTSTVAALLSSDPTGVSAQNAALFLLDSSNGSSACATCHSSTTDPVHNDPIVSTYNNSKHASVAGGASCGDCHLPTGTTSMAHPPQFKMYSSASFIAVNCYNCHTTVDPTFNKTTHAWPSQGLCMNCHNPHNPWPPSMNIYPHFSSYSTAQYIMMNSQNAKNGNACQDCHYQASAPNTFTVFSANRQWAKSSHGDPKGTGYVGPGPVTEASLEANDFKFLGTAAAPVSMAASTNPATAAAKDCARCHTSTGFINFVTPTNPNDPTTALKNMAAWGTAGDRSREMVSCPTCHTPAPFSDTFSRRPVGLSFNNGVNDIATVVAYFNYSSKATKLIKRSKTIYDPGNSNYVGPGDSNICIACHAGRAAGDLIKTTVTSCTNSPTIACRLGNGNQTQGATNNAANTDPAFWSNVDFIDPHRGTTVNMMYPDNLRPAYEYGKSATANTYHLNIGYDNPDAPQGPCVGCHMASINKKHSFSPISTASNGSIGGLTTDLCLGCHGPTGQNNGFDFGANLSTLQAKKTGYFAALSFIKAQLAAKNIFYNPNAAPYFFTTSVAAQQTYANRVTNWYFFDTTLGKAFQGADLMGAAFNLRLLDSDNGWVHNGVYSKRILFDTIDYLDDGVANSVYTTLTTSSLTDATTRLNAQVYIFGSTTNQTRP